MKTLFIYLFAIRCVNLRKALPPPLRRPPGGVGTHEYSSQPLTSRNLMAPKTADDVHECATRVAKLTSSS